MSELDKLRELLDEVGVAYLNRSSDITIGYYTVDPKSITEAMDGSLQMTGLTAQQVMRALGHSYICTNSERTNAACKPITYENGYSTDHLEPGEYHEFWEPACACGNCGELDRCASSVRTAGADWRWTHEHD